MTRLYIADVSDLDIESALKRVSPYRRKKNLRLKGDGAKRLSLGAELLLLSAMGGDFEYTVSRSGKPCSPEVFFSLSHSGSFAVCAISDGEIGVDIEAPRENALSVAKRFFTPEEYEKIAGSKTPEEDFCALWVLKEACIKCSGKGLSALSSVRVRDYFTRHFVYEGYHIALASDSDLGDIEISVEKL